MGRGSPFLRPEFFGGVGGDQRVQHVVQVAVQELPELVERQLNAVVADAVSGKL